MTRLPDPRVLRPAAIATALLLAALSSAVPARAAAGTGVTPRIVNGLETQSHPTVGALLWTPAPGIYYEVCSGTLVGCGTFLTAAHCVCEGGNFSGCGSPDASEYAVFLQNVGIVDVASIAVNPDFVFGSRGDVTVMRLASPTTGVRPTPINVTRRPPFGTVGEILGFGLTRGNGGDAGILRRGEVVTSACSTVDPSQHVCWNFVSPLSAPGFDSNTCSGDSGGPMFADLGDGERVVGVTSGGEQFSCLPNDTSFDADVHVNRGFIAAAAGDDLGGASCGSMPQVGQPGTTVDAFSVRELSKDTRDCRKAATSAYTAFVLAATNAYQACIEGVLSGRRTGPCPDAATLAAVEAAGAKIVSTAFGSRCANGVVRTIDVGGSCAGATDLASLAACLESAGVGSMLRTIDLGFADPQASSPIGDASATACQVAAGRAGTLLLKSLLKADAKCQGQEDVGRVAACPDTKTTSASDKAAARAAARVAKACTDADVATLRARSPFGGACSAATDVASLVECQRTGIRGIADDLHALVRSQTMHLDLSFSVPPGTSRLRVTLNGIARSGNDLDLFVREGLPARAESHDASSTNSGMFEGLEVVSPAAGTWWAHVDRIAGPERIPYQLTITRFGS